MFKKGREVEDPELEKQEKEMKEKVDNADKEYDEKVKA